MAVAIENLPQDKVTFKLLGSYGNGRGDWGVQGFGVPPALGDEVTITKKDGTQSKGNILALVDVTLLNGGDYHWTARLAPTAKKYEKKAPSARRNYQRVITAPKTYRCAECGAPCDGKVIRRDSSGIPGEVCGRCQFVPSVELSFA